MSDWYQEISVEERDRVIETVARGVCKRGMETPAILFLEMHKPISFFASQGHIVTSPMIAPFIGLDNLRIEHCGATRQHRMVQRISPVE